MVVKIIKIQAKTPAVALGFTPAISKPPPTTDQKAMKPKKPIIKVEKLRSPMEKKRHTPEKRK